MPVWCKICAFHPASISALFSALSEKQFRWLLAGNIAFFLAMQGQILTRSVLAWNLTREEVSLAYINIAFALPILLFSLIGGAVTDRVERRSLVMAGQAIIICNEALILVLLLLDALEFWHMILVAALSGLVFPFLMPARTAIVYNVVGQSRLGNALALSAGVVNISRVIGPAMMGLLIDLGSIAAAYAVSVIFSAIALLCLFGIQRTPVIAQKGQHLVADALEGFRYLTSHRHLRLCLLIGFLPMFLAMPFQNLLVVFVDEVWHAGERGLGLMMGAAGLGGVLGSLWVASRGENPKRTKLMLGLALAFPALILLFSWQSSFAVALLILLIANLCISASQTLNNTSAQLLVDDGVRGRLSSFMMLSFGVTPLGVMPLAILANHVGIQAAVAAASILLAFGLLCFILLSPALRHLDDTVRAKLASLESSRSQ